MKKWLRITLSILAALVVIFLGANFALRTSPGATPTEPFITANPLDLSQTKALSQFRSCEGHNYSGRNADGIEETYRTMKHYIEVTDPLAQSTGKVKIFAPFNGRISNIAEDSRGSQVHLSPDVKANGWNLIFFHVDLLPQFNKERTQITAGQHIGFANLANAANFDIALRSFGFGPQRNDSPFHYMTEAVLAEYAAVGVTLDNIVTAKEERDTTPCQLAPGQSGRDAFYAQSEAGKSWIELKQE